jgi:hypothetical protein
MYCCTAKADTMVIHQKTNHKGGSWQEKKGASLWHNCGPRTPYPFELALKVKVMSVLKVKGAWPLKYPFKLTLNYSQNHAIPHKSSYSALLNTKVSEYLKRCDKIIGRTIKRES